MDSKFDGTPTPEPMTVKTRNQNRKQDTTWRVSRSPSVRKGYSRLWAFGEGSELRTCETSRHLKSPSGKRGNTAWYELLLKADTIEKVLANATLKLQA